MYVALRGSLEKLREDQPCWSRPRWGQRRREWKAGSQIFLCSKSCGNGVGSNVVISFALLKKKKPSRYKIENKSPAAKVVGREVWGLLRLGGEPCAFPGPRVAVRG